ncbi:MAG TPA: ribonuclease H-like domain-containing protein [Thermoanaerobaculia bacterium]|jgi:predicted PolB exonuclease-like 3'-5' exonuclease|nr:ribonuclease H-like domain-containing protein [Thermoanaerobaculia bacterium]
MKKLVIDIETVGMPWEEHDPYVREYLIKGMNEAEAEEEKRRGALSPFTGRIVAIGIVNAETGRSCALFEVPGQTEVITRKDGNRTLISGSERQILEKFWEYLGKEDRFISFNGRQFDGPFLMIRSAIQGLSPKRDLVGNRYRFHPNCDLREVLNFNGTINPRQMRFNLDLACKSFGIVSSKTDGMDGRAVETLYRAGRHEDIALYCLEDVRATCELYLKLEKTLLLFEMSFRDAEERAMRRKTAAEQLAITSLDEPSFMESVTATSLTLTTALDAAEEEVVTAKHQAIVLEKLVAEVRDEEL